MQSILTSQVSCSESWPSVTVVLEAETWTIGASGARITVTVFRRITELTQYVNFVCFVHETKVVAGNAVIFSWNKLCNYLLRLRPLNDWPLSSLVTGERTRSLPWLTSSSSVSPEGILSQVISGVGLASAPQLSLSVSSVSSRGPDTEASILTPSGEGGSRTRHHHLRLTLMGHVSAHRMC